MKKTKLTILLAFLFLISKSQGKSEYGDFNIPTKEGAAFYENVDTVVGKSKNQIYQSVKKTVADLFGSAKSVIEIDDKEEGQVLGKGIVEIKHKIQMGVNETSAIKFTLNIQAKDGRLRIQMYEFQKRSSTEKTFYSISNVLTQAKGWRIKFFPAFHEKVQEVMKTFSTTIAKNLQPDSDF